MTASTDNGNGRGMAQGAGRGAGSALSLAALAAALAVAAGIGSGIGAGAGAAMAADPHGTPGGDRRIELAQATQPKTGGAATGGGAPAAAQQKRAPAKTPAAPDAAAAASGGDGGLRQRVESLEEQLVDLQVVIGTLESLAKSGGGSASAAPAWKSSGGTASAGDAARLDGIETQVRALTAQIEQLSAQVRQGGGGTAAAGARRPDGGGRMTEAPAAGGFGSTTVTPGAADSDAIGGLLSGSGSPQNGGATSNGGSPMGAATRQQAAVSPPPAAASEAGAKQLYETAYGHLLQQDYGAAEVAFDDFLKRYPTDGLAGNAQYWLGESHYVRGQYKAAAGAFLKGYQTYGKSAKAPDSLLKLAMSLDRLGQKDQACASYGELGNKFPNAPAHVKARAQSERQRLGCA